MKLTFHVEGGLAHFPGLARESSINTDDLPPDQSEELSALVKAVSRRPQRTPPPHAADYPTYVIRVLDGGTERRLELPDPADDPDAQRLIDVLRARSGRRPHPGRSRSGLVPCRQASR